MVELLTFTSEESPESLKWQAASFFRTLYPMGFVNENPLPDWVAQKEDHPIHIVLVEQGLLISHANVVWKYLVHAGETYKAYGLTGVFTHPSFRGQGYGSRVVDAGTERIRKSDADIAMLYCDESLMSFYASHGWTHLDKSVSYTGEKARALRVDDEILMMLFISSKGQRGRAAFEQEPIYFISDYTW
jgi:aminoglycoside 2'-N-acetyltransferase I